MLRRHGAAAGRRPRAKLPQRAPARASGSVDSLTAGLACGEASPLAWRFLQPAVDFFLTVTDDEATQAMRVLAQGGPGDVPVVAGESGAAGFARLPALARDPAQRRQAGLDGGSRVLLFNTEGATAPAVYASLAGAGAPAVLLAQARGWRARAPDQVRAGRCALRRVSYGQASLAIRHMGPATRARRYAA